jgi:Tfp pilus assembly protein PilF
LFSTLVSNDRDLPPFAGTAADAPARAGELLQAGSKALKNGDAGQAALAYSDALNLDSTNADALFGSARALLATGDSAAARRHFLDARDHDRMRFRASTGANGIIAAVAKEKGAWLVDFADILAARSPARTIGHEWICDHLHPDARGYYMLAAAFYVGIQHMRLLPPADPGFRLRQEPYGVTPLDRAIGLRKIGPIMRRWPFASGTVATDSALAHEDSACVRIATDYVRGDGVWSRAHADMALSWMQRKNWEAARRECEAIALFVPADPWPYRMMAETYRQQTRWDLCAEALAQAARRSRQQGMVQYELGLARMNSGDMRGAIEAMTAATQAPEFSRDERANARFYLAGLLSDDSRPDEARRVLRTLLADQPAFQPARVLLNRLEGSKK